MAQHTIVFERAEAVSSPEPTRPQNWEQVNNRKDIAIGTDYLLIKLSHQNDNVRTLFDYIYAMGGKQFNNEHNPAHMRGPSCLSLS